MTEIKKPKVVAKKSKAWAIFRTHETTYNSGKKDEYGYDIHITNIDNSNNAYSLRNYNSKNYTDRLLLNRYGVSPGQSAEKFYIPQKKSVRNYGYEYKKPIDYSSELLINARNQLKPVNRDLRVGGRRRKT